MKNKLLILLAIPFLLTACGTTSPDTIYTHRDIDIPDAMFTCEDNGVRPSGANIMESAVATYINSLEFSNKDCRIRLRELQVLIRCLNDDNCSPDYLYELIELYRSTPSQ